MVFKSQKLTKKIIISIFNNNDNNNFNLKTIFKNNANPIKNSY